MNAHAATDGATPPALLSLRATVRGRDAIALVPISESDRWSVSTRRSAEETLAGGWSDGDHPTIAITPPIEWDEVCSANRTWAFHLHSWDPIGSLLSAHAHTGEERFLHPSLALADDWCRRYPIPSDGDSFAWYDMAIGLRAARLAYLVDAACRSESVADDRLARLVGSIEAHRAAFADERRFAAHSNHGLYFAAGQIILADAFSWLPGMQQSRELAHERLTTMLRTQFTPEGVHREHSPDYHRMVLRTLTVLMRAGLLRDETLEELIVRSDRALAWFVLPNGRLAMLGDSPSRSLGPEAALEALSDESRYLLSRGTIGAQPAATRRIFDTSGYAVVRGAWRDAEEWERGCMLVLNAAFHSRVHKHADDQSIIWYDRGAEILVDPGRFGYLGKSAVGSPEWLDGYWYADPRRMYVESTRAHNCVEIDGRDYARRGVTPYGSALRRSAIAGDATALESSVIHFGTIRHTRRIVVLPGEWLVIDDELVDAGGAAHEYLQRFHFAPELDVSAEEGALRILLPDGALLCVASLTRDDLVDPVAGILEPRLLGWIARKDGELLPSPTAGFRARGPEHRFVTLLRFSGQPPRDLRCAATSERLEAGWSDLCRHRVVVSHAANGDLSLEYTTDDDEISSEQHSSRRA